MMRQHGEQSVDPFRELTGREIAVLRLLAQGKSNADIAEALVLSDKTVRNHVSAIFGKLHLENRVVAATFALQHGIDNYKDETGV